MFKYFSNAPKPNKEYSEYAKILYEAINEEFIYNIGVIAPYGAGKSTLIKTYKNIYGSKGILTISLANSNQCSKGTHYRPDV